MGIIHSVSPKLSAINRILSIAQKKSVSSMVSMYEDQAEIMEIRVPFGSSYAYRYIGSIEQKEWKIFGLYRNRKLLNIKPSLVLKPNDVILLINGVPVVQIELKTLQISPNVAMKQIVDYKNDLGN